MTFIIPKKTRRQQVLYYCGGTFCTFGWISLCFMPFCMIIAIIITNINIDYNPKSYTETTCIINSSDIITKRYNHINLHGYFVDKQNTTHTFNKIFVKIPSIYSREYMNDISLKCNNSLNCLYNLNDEQSPILPISTDFIHEKIWFTVLYISLSCIVLTPLFCCVACEFNRRYSDLKETRDMVNMWYKYNLNKNDGIKNRIYALENIKIH